MLRVEPGIIFWDTMREYHNVEYANPLTSTNPRGEQPHSVLHGV